MLGFKMPTRALRHFADIFPSFNRKLPTNSSFLCSIIFYKKHHSSSSIRSKLVTLLSVFCTWYFLTMPFKNITWTGFFNTTGCRKPWIIWNYWITFTAMYAFHSTWQFSLDCGRQCLCGDEMPSDAKTADQLNCSLVCLQEISNEELKEKFPHSWVMEQNLVL